MHGTVGQIDLFVPLRSPPTVTAPPVANLFLVRLAFIPVKTVGKQQCLR
jgi:hypothetical protein